MATDSITQKRALLKLVHPGRIVETYDRPVTAAEIMSKYPRHCVTRPDVFKYPWVVVRPESVLQPGNVFYVVPHHTIRRLLRSKQCPEQLVYPKEAAGPGLDGRTNNKSSEKARYRHWQREKIDCPGGLSVKDEVESCSYDESSVEAPHSHQLARVCSLNCNKSTENHEIREYGLGYRREVHQIGHCSGETMPNWQLPQRFVSKKASGNMDYKGHKDGRKFPDRRFWGQERQPNTALRHEDPYESSVEITHIHQLLKRLSLSRESCSQCEAGREDTRLKTHGETNTKKHSPDQFIEPRSAVDFTFQVMNEAPKDMEEFSPDLTPFHCLPRRKSPADARKNTENYKPGDCRRGISAPKHPVYVSNYFTELGPKKQCNDQFIDNGSHSSDQLRTLGNVYRLKSEEFHHGKFTANTTKDHKLVPVVTCRTEHCDSNENLTKLKSCIKKSGFRLHDPRVKFNLPGEEDKKLRVEVFEFQPSDSP